MPTIPDCVLVRLCLCYRPAAMAPAKKTSGRKKTPAGSTSGTKTSRLAGAKKKTSVARKATKKTTAAGRAGSDRRTAKKAAAKKTPKKTSAKRTAKKTAAKKTSAKRTPKKTAKRTAKKTIKKATPQKAAARKTAKKPTRKTVAGRPTGGRTAGQAAAGPKARPRARAVKFDKKQLAEIRQQLESERGNLLAQLEELTSDSFDGTQSDMTGEIGLDDDFADAGSATFERERDLSIQNNVRDLIDQMNRAIQRIEDGNYGTCERCGNPIEAARLKALPHALLCMDCKRREERAR
jgi:RNA polymerase-binding protein DksA